MELIGRVAKRFSKEIRDFVSEEQMKLIIERNREEKSPSICHSHDFCDANEIMIRAMKKVTGNNDPCSEQFIKIAGPAWELAFQKEFSV